MPKIRSMKASKKTASKKKPPPRKAPARARKRVGAAATREAILQAARTAFTRLGYDGAGVREIAGEAGATAALVNRYFGSKEALFVEAVPSCFTMEGLLPQERDGFAEAISRYVLTKDKSASGGFDPTLAMLRSVGNAEAAALMRDGIERGVVTPVAEWLGGEHARCRAAMFVAVLAGVSVVRDVLALEPLKTEAETTTALMTRLVQVLVDDP